jgi:hypothetical protein
LGLDNWIMGGVDIPLAGPKVFLLVFVPVAVMLALPPASMFA